MDSDRGTGRTTRQMLAAPQGAIYVSYGNVDYYRDLARKHGREDLKIYSDGQFTPRDAHRFYGRTFSGIVLDHAISEFGSDKTVADVWELYNRLRPYIRSTQAIES